jgi:N-methylhydantoinase A/oxoprolinase/acetone carboxylase beta subunit
MKKITEYQRGFLAGQKSKNEWWKKRIEHFTKYIYDLDIEEKVQLAEKIANSPFQNAIMKLLTEKGK